MPVRLQITCIRKRDRQSPHERIQQVGGKNEKGSPWCYSEDDAIKAITEGRYAFWTRGGGKTVDVVVATHLGRRYLKTTADGIVPDNLLALPECP